MSVNAVNTAIFWAVADKVVTEREAHAINEAMGKRASGAEISAVNDVITGKRGATVVPDAASPMQAALSKPTEANYIAKFALGGAVIGASPGLLMLKESLTAPVLARGGVALTVAGLGLGAGVGALIGWATAD